jgi:hypothetical protein
MDTGEIEQRLADVKTRLSKLPAEDQERALDGFAEVINILALPRAKDETVSLSISLDREGNVEYPSG